MWQAHRQVIRRLGLSLEVRLCTRQEVSRPRMDGSGPMYMYGVSETASLALTTIDAVSFQAVYPLSGHDLL